MARKMQVNRLEKDELEYLLTIRGVGLGSCEEMRKSLSSAVRLEREGDSIKYPSYPFTAQEDQVAVKKKLDDVKKMVDDFNAGKKSSEAQKLQTKMAYVLERIEHMDVEEEESRKQKSELLALALSLMDRFHDKMEDFENRQAAPAALSWLQSQVGPQAFQVGIHEAAGSSPLRVPVLPSTSATKTIPPHKWDLKKFSGDARSTSVHAFFEKVEELRVARNVSKEALLDAGIDLFEDKAYQFYKECRKRVSDWDELVDEFRDEYLSANHNDLLFDELRKRTQHPSETIGVYLAVMSSYFNRLGCPISEEVKLSIVTKNLHPFYQDRLRDPLPNSMSELRAICRSMEARRDLMNSYVEPSSSRRSSILEKDLAYVGIGEDLTAVEAPLDRQDDRHKAKEVVCYKCKKPGHRAIGCAVPGKKRCFKWKRKPTHLSGRLKRVDCSASTDKILPILDFILDHAQNDERPYLKVNVFGRTLLGLLDSGATTTILGSKGWQVLKDLDIQLDTAKKIKCTVANGQICEANGECELLIGVKDRFRLIKVLVVLDLPHILILGTNFWRSMGIVPDLRHDDWHFSDQPVMLDSVDHIRSQTVLTPMEEMRLEAVIDPSEEEDNEPEELLRKDGIKKLFRDVKQRLIAAAKKSERTYNLRRRNEQFAVNQLVWRRNFAQSNAANYFTSKLAPKFLGPFHVLKRVSPWTYELADKDGNSKGGVACQRPQIFGAIREFISAYVLSSVLTERALIEQIIKNMKVKIFLELEQSDTETENRGNIKDNGGLERTEDSDPSFETEQEEGENDSTDGEVSNEVFNWRKESKKISPLMMI
ncbi:hypothetical protein NQ317_017213 [Molorchus minor]|uniref:CCHC-type domain-containing protein n=1 Tax=Molorchus minor TaxID=1323400 RepID=A0ABQ9JVS5_9CUCU|nr:hypothetical protein NQ317_017213 [Molorchus minor]